MAKIKRIGSWGWQGFTVVILGLCSLIGRTPPSWAKSVGAPAPSLQERLYAQGSWIQPKGKLGMPGPGGAQPKGVILQPKGVILQPKGVPSETPGPGETQPKGKKIIPGPDGGLKSEAEAEVDAQMHAKMADLQQRLQSGAKLDASDLAFLLSNDNAQRLDMLTMQLQLLLEQLKTIQERLNKTP